MDAPPTPPTDHERDEILKRELKATRAAAVQLVLRMANLGWMGGRARDEAAALFDMTAVDPDCTPEMRQLAELAAEELRKGRN